MTLLAALWLFLEPEYLLHQLASFRNPEKGGRLEVRVSTFERHLITMLFDLTLLIPYFFSHVLMIMMVPG